jgi:hypothetical protein
MWFLFFKTTSFATNSRENMNRTKWVILLSVLSSIMVLVGALAKIQHWDSIKPLMLIGMALQFGVIVYALIPLISKKNN